jgi:hypothetical protein
MCKHGDEVILSVPIPANLSSTGEFEWKEKAVDSCIALIVKALNDAGVYTSGCCCGHGENDGNIILHDGRTLIVKHGGILESDSMEADSVRIGPFDYAVKFIEGLESHDKRKLDGHISHHQTSITIEAAMTNQARTQVLWHEVLHGIANHANLDLTEDEVDVLSFGVYQVLKDNSVFAKMSSK